LAERLGSELSLPVYHVDAYFDEHAEKAAEESVFARIRSWSSEQIFLRDVNDMLADFIALGYEQFPRILDDLKQEAWCDCVIVEGCALIPELVANTKGSDDKVLYLVPAESFQRFHYSNRSWIVDVLSNTSEPVQAWENWQQRDAIYSQFIMRQANHLDFPVITVDETQSIDDVYQQARVYLKLPA